MKVHLIKKQSIENYVRNYADSKASFKTWLSIVKLADWKNPGDMISTFSNVDILGKGTSRIVFNIGGNKYRMICTYHFGKVKTHLFIKWIGTHAEYTKLCRDGLQYDVNMY